jgi:hypothetical protein
MDGLTRQELKEKLASKNNKLATKLVATFWEETTDIIPKTLKLLDLGCPDRFFKRDPAHPRSRYRIVHTLDQCVESLYASNENNNKQNQLLEVFHLLLKRGFKEGESTCRGNLFHHILNNVFYLAIPKNAQETNKRNMSIKLAEILVDNKKVDINRYAANSYIWVNSLYKLNLLLGVGANPKGNDLIDCALNYVTCSGTLNENPEDRIKVIEKLLSLGATPKEPIAKKLGPQEIFKKLQENGLLAQIDYYVTSHKILNAQ